VNNFGPSGLAFTAWRLDCNESKDKEAIILNREDGEGSCPRC